MSARGARRAGLIAYTALAVLFVIAPLAVVVVNSFNTAAFSRFPPPGFSLRWYRHLFGGSGDFGAAALYTIALGLVSTAVALLAGTLAAYALQRRRIRGRELVRSTLLMPIVLPKMVLGVGLFIFFSQTGIYGSLWSLALAHALISLPFVVALLTAALVGVDRSLEEAARDLGAGRLRTFRLVVLPQIRTPMIVAALFAFIVSADQLESTVFLTRPGRSTLPVAMFNYALQYQDPTIAALSSLTIAVGIVLVVLTGVLLRRGDIVNVLGRAEQGGSR